MSFLQNLKVKRGSFQLDIPEMRLPPGLVTLLFGESGSGKSTLISLLTGQIQGEPFLWEEGGVRLSELEPSERRLGVVFQELGLFPHMSARQNIGFAAAARKVDEGQVEEFLKDVEPVFEMRPFLDLRLDQLSGGQKQRVAMVRSLVAEPRVLLWDEPFSALHHDLKQKVRFFLKSYVARRQIPALLISHDPQDQEFFAPSVLRIHQGRLTELDR